jgi:hypothetical protein
MQGGGGVTKIEGEEEAGWQWGTSCSLLLGVGGD